MALQFKPHTVTVLAGSEPVDPQTLAVGAPQFAAGVEVRCQVTPERADTVYRDTGLDIKNPRYLMGDIEDAAKFHVDDLVTWTNALTGTTERLRVKTEAQTFATGLPTDHFSLYLEGLNLS